MVGFIKFFKRDKGYGFITPLDCADGEADIFFHARSLVHRLKDEDEIARGTHVMFEVQQFSRGTAAKNVRLKL